MKRLAIHVGSRTSYRFDFDSRLQREIKRHGGRWDPDARCWWTPDDEPTEAIMRYAERTGYRTEVS